EAMTWGKVDPEQLPDTVTCYLDSTVALPLLTVYALATRAPRAPRRLMDRLQALADGLGGGGRRPGGRGRGRAPREPGGHRPVSDRRVALGGYPPRAPTDPDVRNYRIRLVQPTVHTRRYTEWTTRAAGSGYRSSRPHRLAQPKQPFQLRRESHFRQI